MAHTAHSSGKGNGAGNGTVPLWDAVIVGAGPAGCAAAYDLAAAGWRVLLLDRAQFPRLKACAGGLTMKTIRALRYPVDPVVRRWESALVLEGEGRSHTLSRRAPICAMTVREELDAYCLEQTLRRGADFRRIGAILGLERHAGSVTLHCADGESFEARYLIGADGVHSRVRSLLGDAPWFRSGFAIEANVPYVEGEPHPPLTFDFAAAPWGYGWLFPRNDHVNVGLYTAAASPRGLDRQALSAYIAARCGPKARPGAAVGQFLGLGAAGYQPPAGSRVLLAGDAAGFVDPLTGEGLYGAVRSGQAAALALHAALQDGSVGDESKMTGTFAQALAPLQADLQVAEHAAARFYAEPASGFRLLRIPLLPRAALRAYAEGTSLARLLQMVRTARTARFLLPASG